MMTFKTRCPSCQAMNRLPATQVSDVPLCGKCRQHLLDGHPVEGTSENFQALMQSDIPVVIDFWAPWCNPCVGFAPVFEESAKNRHRKVRFIKINTEAEQELAAQFQIRSIPTIMVYKQGQRLNIINGALPQSQFDQWLDETIRQSE
ncbi:thioredoxin TrxC [Vibrio aerogenes]|nr:thioredoxin TrxC [Vibrio aerogenes]